MAEQIKIESCGEILIISQGDVDIEVPVERLFAEIEPKIFAQEACERIRSHADGAITDVLDAFDDDFIEEEAEKRGIFGDAFENLSSWDAEKLRGAILNDDGRRVVDLMRPLVGRCI